jgi:two-component sensor histidine kinase
MNQKNDKNILEFFIHFIAWGLVFALPFIIFGKDTDINIWDKMLHHAVVVSSMLLVFYLNYFLLIEKVLFQRKIWKYLLYNLLLIVIVGVAVHFWLQATMLPPMHHGKEMHPELMHPELLPVGIAFMLRDILTLCIIAILSVTIKMTAKWYTTEVKRQEEEKKRTEAELTNLRQQLNPHFLFNTLNNIYALIGISPDKAQEAMLEFSKLLRYVLYDNTENYVSLERELNFVENYVELMRLRLSPDVELNMNIDVTESGKTIAPLLFISLIENAFKHGTSPDKRSFIHINIEITKNGYLHCVIKNSYFPKDETDRSGSGIGLENLRRRLQILYPEKHVLRTEKEGDDFIADLVVPIY